MSAQPKDPAATTARWPNLARDDPAKKRTRQLHVGSQEEIGRLLVEVLRDEGGMEVPVFTEGSFWEYSPPTGLWTAVEDHVLHRIIGSYDGSEYPSGKQSRKLQVSDGFAKGAIRRAAVHVAVPEFFASAAPVLAFANGVVRVTDTGKIELLPHSPEHRARAGYPFAYDSGAKCERYDRMQREHFLGDADAEQKIAFMWEFFGACLLGIATKYQKCLALPSTGRTGRSTTLECIEAAMPADSVSHVSMIDLLKPERLAKLPGKRLNFSDEAPPDAFLQAEEFKKVVVGNVVTGEEKYKPSMEFRPIAGHVVPTQHTSSAEPTDAFFGRFVVLRYRRSFEGDPKRDYDLAKKIIDTEIPGIVARLIAGGAGLLKRGGGYAVPPSHTQELEKWKLSTDTVRAFLAEKYTRATSPEPRTQGYDANGRPNGKPIKKHDWTSGSALHSDYCAWCEDNKRSRVNKQEFSHRVEKIGYPPEHVTAGNFYRLRRLDAAQAQESVDAKAGRRPPKEMKDAISVLHGGSTLKLAGRSDS